MSSRDYDDNNVTQKLRDLLQEDVKALPEYASSLPGRWAIAQHLLGRRFFPVVLFRLSACCFRGRWLFRKLSGFLWRLNALLHQCEIDPSAQIGGGLHLAHPMGVVIAQVIIGRNVTIFQNVTIGTSPRAPEYTGPESRPIIGNDVRIYTGAVITGGLRIGDGSWIGANTVVLKDVPERCLVGGVPARIIRQLKDHEK